ncbi:MAG: nuclear transport factor 2 family protein [Gemmatimonadota bacterium]|nr:MAG: nuclear transport factor 2 family protein [Gemmatimonadota bacterium]
MHRLFLAAIALTVLAACRPATTELSEDQKAAIADEIAALHADAAKAIRARDVGSWLAYFENTDELTFTSCVQDGAVAAYRSWSARADTTYAHYAAIASMDRFEWGDLHTRVLAPNVAVVATTYEAVATDTAGVSFAGNATWVAVWVRTNGTWKMANVAETWNWPVASPEGT